MKFLLLLAGGVAAESGGAKDAPSAADALGQDFYKVILENEPFKSTKVSRLLNLAFLFFCSF
jgi:hypothetical protein